MCGIGCRKDGMSLHSRARRIQLAVAGIGYQRVLADLLRLRLRPQDDHHYIDALRSEDYDESVCTICQGAFPTTRRKSETVCSPCKESPGWKQQQMGMLVDRSHAEIELGVQPDPDPDYALAWKRRLERESRMMAEIAADPLGWRPRLEFPDGPLVFYDIQKKGRLLPEGSVILVTATDEPFGSYHNPVIVKEEEAPEFCRGGYRRLNEAEDNRIFGEAEPDDFSGFEP